MQVSEVIDKIIYLAKNKFDEGLIEEFIATFRRLSANAKVVGSILQISRDKGEELEIGFFTSDIIADITLSAGNVYSCTYPLSKIRNIGLSDTGSKLTLTITGEKKFDYNVLKPGCPNALTDYEANLRQYLAD
jgi:hypothetical protein